MRLAAIASALAIVVCAAVFGAIFLQKASVSPQAPLPPQAAPADGQAPAVTTAVAPAIRDGSPSKLCSPLEISRSRELSIWTKI